MNADFVFAALCSFLISELAAKAARVLEGSFDIEIVEAHHNQKIGF